MPLNGLQETLRAGPLSRKRTYEQITRSESQSITPPPPPKRRRTNLSPSRSITPLVPTARETTSPGPRFVGDGLDYRRPAPSTMAQAPPPLLPPQEQNNTIDLTLEEDSDDADDDLFVSNASSIDFDHFSRGMTPSVAPSTDRVAQTRIRPRAPPFNRNDNGNDNDNGSGNARPTAPEVIDISSGEDDEDDGIEITGSRQLLRRVLPPIRHLGLSQHSTPPAELRRSNALTFADTLRNIPAALFGMRRPPTTAAAVPAGPLLDHATAILAGRLPEPLNLATYDSVGEMDDYDNIHMDYGAAAFVIEDPAADDEPIEEYKRPALPTRPGFTRDLEEDGDVLVCVGCEDELAAGENEVKQQVWVSKRCGHVYCGACASRRVVYRKGNDRDRKKAKKQKLDDLTHCSVDGCPAKLTSKTAMFQIYL